MSEQQPLLQDDVEASQATRWSRLTRTRERLAKALETRTFHLAVIGLITIDSAIVLADLSYTFLSDSCNPEKAPTPLWLEILSNISLVITVLFLVELFLCAWAFGPSYYSPLRSILHFCDGTVIVATFVIDVVLRGRELELASLLVLFRLVRFGAEAAVGVGEINEGTVEELEELKKVLAEKEQALQAAQQELKTLRSRRATSDADS